MNKAQAIEAIKKDPTEKLFLVNRDTTGQWYDYKAVWLDENGDLVMAHPTDDNRDDIEAPADGVFKSR